jgi:hypothetical protein
MLLQAPAAHDEQQAGQDLVWQQAQLLLLLLDWLLSLLLLPWRLRHTVLACCNFAGMLLLSLQQAAEFC